MLDEFLRPNFRRREFACRGRDCCGGAAPVDDRLVTALQILRLMVGAPVIISSGFRCIANNTRIGGSTNSQHTLGRAADIRVNGMTTAELAAVAEQINEFKQGGIGVYGSFVHVDVRDSGPARWTG